jgi:hypothetical protein
MSVASVFDTSSVFVDPVSLSEFMNFFPYKEVSDELILRHLTNKNFVVVKGGNHRGDKDSIDHHAQRIATLVNMTIEGEHIDPVCLFAYDKTIEIDDGHHRWRASIYVKGLLHVIWHHWN